MIETKRTSLIKLSLTLVILVVGCVLISYLGKYQSAKASTSDEEPYSVYILAGQSNAAGVDAYRHELAGSGIFAENHPADTQTQFWWAGANGQGIQDARIAAFFGFTPGSEGDLGWSYSGAGSRLSPGSVRLRNNINEFQTTDLLGSEFGIARTLYDMGRRNVIILKVTYGFQSQAISNSPLIPFDWNVDSVSSNPDRPKSYKQLKDEFQRLTTYLKSQGKKYTVDGIFWMQGETDMLDNSYANSYQAGIMKLADYAIVDLELHMQSKLVIGNSDMTYCMDRSYPVDGMHCEYTFFSSIEPWTLDFGAYEDNTVDGSMAMRQQKVQAGQQAVASTNPRATLVYTGDLPKGWDKTHLRATGQVELGRRFVTMYNQPTQMLGSDDYDNDGILNSDEDTGRGATCQITLNSMVINAANNGNLGDDDTDCDGIPDYLDGVVGPGS